MPDTPWTPSPKAKPALSSDSERLTQSEISSEDEDDFLALNEQASAETLEVLRRKFPTLEQFWRDHEGYGFEGFTEGFARFFLSHAPADESQLLTPDEIEALREEARVDSEYFRVAFRENPLRDDEPEA